MLSRQEGRITLSEPSSLYQRVASAVSTSYVTTFAASVVSGMYAGHAMFESYLNCNPNTNGDVLNLTALVAIAGYLVSGQRGDSRWRKNTHIGTAVALTVAIGWGYKNLQELVQTDEQYAGREQICFEQKVERNKRALEVERLRELETDRALGIESTF